jgi:hypothetical protein
MTPNEMEEFLDMLDRYGGRLETWPPEARAKAEAWRDRCAVAAGQIDAMRRVEAALAATRATVAGGANATAARAMQAHQENPRQAMARRISWGVAGALALVAGVYIGSLPLLGSSAPAEIVADALNQSGGVDVW